MWLLLIINHPNVEILVVVINLNNIRTIIWKQLMILKLKLDKQLLIFNGKGYQMLFTRQYLLSTKHNL